MRILIAPDKFKDSLTAAAVAEAIAAGLRRADPNLQLDLCPMADGGEGTVAALVAATNGRIETRDVTGPLPGMHVNAHFGILGDGQTAVIEMASASGLHLLAPRQRNPLRTTTYGTGELLRAAVDLGVRKIILGIGGSATVDGGIGAAQAFGARIDLGNGSSYTAGNRKLTGADLLNVLSIDTRRTAPAPVAPPPAPSRKQKPRRAPPPGTLDISARRSIARAAESPHDTSTRSSVNFALAHYGPNVNRASLADGVEFIVACDVANPLSGPNGAARIFGPQKGATPQQVDDLDRALSQLARRIRASDLAHTPGAGAAGGLGFGMLAFFGASLRSGIEIVMDASNFRERLARADLCITGEGRLDAQSLAGKTAVGVARMCKQLNVPCIALAGSIGAGADQAIEEGLRAYFSICDGPMNLETAIAEAPRLLATLASNVLRTIQRA